MSTIRLCEVFKSLSQRASPGRFAPQKYQALQEAYNWCAIKVVEQWPFSAALNITEIGYRFLERLIVTS